MTSPSTHGQRRLALVLAVAVLGVFGLLTAGLVQFLSLTPPVAAPDRDLRKAAERFVPPERTVWSIDQTLDLPSGGRLLVSGRDSGQPVLLVGGLGTGPWLWSYLSPILGETRQVAVLEWPAPLDTPEEMVRSVGEALAALRARGHEPALVGLGAGANAAAAAVSQPPHREAQALAGPITALALIAPLGPREWSGFRAQLGGVLSGSAERAAVSPTAAPGAWRRYQENVLRAGVVAPAAAGPFIEDARALPVSFTTGFVDRFWRAPNRNWATEPLEHLPLAPLLIDLAYDQFVPPAETDQVAAILAASPAGLAGRLRLDSGHLAPIDWRWRELAAILKEHLRSGD